MRQTAAHRRSRKLTLLLLGVAGLPGHASAASLFGVDVAASTCDDSTLLRIDTATGAGSGIGPITGFGCVSGLSRLPDGTLLGVSSRFQGGTGELIEIDPVTAAGTPLALGPLGLVTVDALAVDAAGIVWVAGNGFMPTQAGPDLYRIDLAIPLVQRVGGITLPDPSNPAVRYRVCVEGLAFAPPTSPFAGTLFASADDYVPPAPNSCREADVLITIDTATADGTRVGPLALPTDRKSVV